MVTLEDLTRLCVDVDVDDGVDGGSGCLGVWLANWLGIEV